MHSKANVRIHNRFDIEVVRDGEIIQRGQAENIVLDRIYTRLCNYSTYFSNIVYGSGTGVLDPTRTTLFARVGSAAATTVETIKAFPVSKWTRKTTLGLTTSNDQWIKEVGISDDTTSINTHALITDALGSPLEIYKTELDIITIYATVFIELQNKDANNFFISLPDSNVLLNYLCGGAAPAPKLITDPNESYKNLTYIRSSATPTKTVDVPNKKIIYTGNYTTTASNGPVEALVLDNLYKANLFSSGVCVPYNISNTILGVGDGLNQNFSLKHPRVVTDLVVKEDGNVVNSADYTVNTIDDPVNLISLITFLDEEPLQFTRISGLDGTDMTAPAGGSITRTYKVNKPILNRMFYFRIYGMGYPVTATFILQSSNNGVDFTALKSIQFSNTQVETKTWIANANCEYLRIILSVYYTSRASSGRIAVYDQLQQVVFNTPPGLVEGEELGVGDGVENTFTLEHTPLEVLEIYINDVAVDSEDYTVDGDDVIFDTPPANTEVVTADYRYEVEITADYTVPYIPKTTDNVLDVSMEITFGPQEEE